MRYVNEGTEDWNGKTRDRKLIICALVCVSAYVLLSFCMNLWSLLGDCVCVYVCLGYVWLYSFLMFIFYFCHKLLFLFIFFILFTFFLEIRMDIAWTNLIQMDCFFDFIKLNKSSKIVI